MTSDETASKKLAIMIVDDKRCLDFVRIALRKRLFAFDTAQQRSQAGLLFGRPFVDLIDAGVEVWPFNTSDPREAVSEKVKAENPGRYPELVFGGLSVNASSDGEPDDATPPHLDVALLDLNLRGEEAGENPDAAVEGLYLYRLLSRRHENTAYLVYTGYPVVAPVIKPLAVRTDELRHVKKGFFPVRLADEDTVMDGVLTILRNRRDGIVRGWSHHSRQRANDILRRVLRLLSGDDYEAAAEELNRHVSGGWSLGRLYFEEAVALARILNLKLSDDTGESAGVEFDEDAERSFVMERLRWLEASVFPKQTGIVVGGTFDEILEEYEWAWVSNVSILIQGEIGSGKTTLAKMIHKRSRRSDGPYVQLSCGEFMTDTKDLLVELFGVGDRVFTEVAGRIGKLAEADGGTLFLDEIHLLPRACVGPLLRFLDDYTVRPLGVRDDPKKRSAKSRRSPPESRVDVRMLFGSNENIEELTSQGSFNDALYSRISDLTLVVPPLRDRPQEIPALVQRFSEDWKHSAEADVVTPRFSPEAIEALQRRRWRFNVRELRGFVGRTLSRIEFVNRDGEGGRTVRPTDLEQERTEYDDGQAILSQARYWLRTAQQPTRAEFIRRYGQRTLALLVDAVKKNKIPELSGMSNLAQRLNVAEGELEQDEGKGPLE